MTLHSKKVEEVRSIETGDKDWDNPDILWIPPAFVARMKANGMYVAWIRFTEGNDKPDRRLSQKFHQGWEFVRPEGIPEWKTPPTIEHSKFSHLVAVGDVALAMIPLEMFNRYKGLEDKRAQELTQAVRNQLMSQSDRKMPIHDNSKTTVTAGGRVMKFGE